MTLHDSGHAVHFQGAGPIAGSCLSSSFAAPIVTVRPVLVIVEGVHDVEFLRRISGMLHAKDERLPDLEGMERRGELIFIPIGGVGIASWTQRFRPLDLPEFYLLDGELPPETDRRRRILQSLDDRPRSIGRLTSKRSAENYLHPAAIAAICGVEIEFGDLDGVVGLLARAIHQRWNGGTWDRLTPSQRRRRMAKAKKRLNTQVASQMIPALLAVRDPTGEVEGWLHSIAELASP